MLARENGVFASTYISHKRQLHQPQNATISPTHISHTHRTFPTFRAGTSKISRELLFSQVPSTFSRRFRASDNHPFRNHLSNQPSKWLLNPRPASPLASRRVTYVSPRGGSLRCLPENKKGNQGYRRRWTLHLPSCFQQPQHHLITPNDCSRNEERNRDC